MTFTLKFREDARRKQRADVQKADADRIRTQMSILVIVPADGTTAATAGNGNFGTLPFFGQLTDKPLLACVF